MGHRRRISLRTGPGPVFFPLLFEQQYLSSMTVTSVPPQMTSSSEVT